MLELSQISTEGFYFIFNFYLGVIYLLHFVIKAYLHSFITEVFFCNYTLIMGDDEVAMGVST